MFSIFQLNVEIIFNGESKIEKFVEYNILALHKELKFSMENSMKLFLRSEILFLRNLNLMLLMVRDVIGHYC